MECSSSRWMSRLLVIARSIVPRWLPSCTVYYAAPRRLDEHMIPSYSSRMYPRFAMVLHLASAVMLGASSVSGQGIASPSVSHRWLLTAGTAGDSDATFLIRSRRSERQPRDSVPQTVAADPRAVQPERPTVATHAYTVTPGYVEIEAGVQDMQPSSASQLVVPVVVKLGIAPRLQLELQGGYMRSTAAGPPSTTDAGASDMALALKQRVLDAAPVVHDFSVQGSIKFATGSHGVGTETTDASLLLISSRQIGRGELDLNAGYTRRSGNGATAPISATLLAASFGAPIHGVVGAVAEFFGYPGTGGPAGAPPEVGFLTGPTLQVEPWMVLDAGVILNVQHMGANAAYAGLTYNVGRIPGFPAPRW